MNEISSELTISSDDSGKLARYSSRRTGPHTYTGVPGTGFAGSWRRLPDGKIPNDSKRVYRHR